jgi:hypothetical protein
MHALSQKLFKSRYIQVKPHLSVEIQMWKMLTLVDLCCVDFINLTGIVAVFGVRG